MPEFKKSETVMFQAVWRKAFREGGLVCNFTNEGSAQRARLQLYNAVKKAKAGKEMDDMELTKASDALEIVWNNAEHTSLRLQKKSDNGMTQGILEALGATSVDEFQDENALASSEKLMRELGMLGGNGAVKGDPTSAPPAEHQANPFYGKRES